MSFSRLVRKALLDHFFGKTVYTPPATIYVGISFTQPTSVGGNITPPTDITYARQPLTNVSWGAASLADPTITLNIVGLSFPVASEDWFTAQNVEYVTFFSALTAGDYLGFGRLARPKPVYSGDQFIIPAEKLRMGLS